MAQRATLWTLAALVGILAIVLFLPLWSMDRKPRQDTSLSRLHMLSMAISAYADDNEGTLPSMQNIAALKKAVYPTYLREEKFFRQPDTQEPYRTNPFLSGKRWADVKRYESWMVSVYGVSHPDSDNYDVLFLDGHVRRIPAAEWPRIQK